MSRRGRRVLAGAGVTFTFQRNVRRMAMIKMTRRKRRRMRLAVMMSWEGPELAHLTAALKQAVLPPPRGQ